MENHEGSTRSFLRMAGWAAIASGVFGLLAHAALLTVVFTRTTVAITEQGFVLFRIHDAIAILQYLFMIPALVALYRLSQIQVPGMSRATLTTGIAAVLLTVLFLILIFPGMMASSYYMIPQGILGVWLILINWRLTGILSRDMTWFGIVVGIGLALVGASHIGYAIFVNPIVLRIPAAPPGELQIPVETTANTIVHVILTIGSFIGVLMLPIWTIVLGRKLLRVRVEPQPA